MFFTIRCFTNVNIGGAIYIEEIRTSNQFLNNSNLLVAVVFFSYSRIKYMIILNLTGTVKVSYFSTKLFHQCPYVKQETHIYLSSNLDLYKIIRSENCFIFFCGNPQKKKKILYMIMQYAGSCLKDAFLCSSLQTLGSLRNYTLSLNKTNSGPN